MKERMLLRHAVEFGFQRNAIQKAFVLLELLEALGNDPYLRSRIVLKGGTALNLFVFDVPRLSVDLDFNCIGALERNVMVVERPAVEGAIKAACDSLGFRTKHIPTSHAGGKWRFTRASGRHHLDMIELDLNFMYRRPLWPH